MCASTPNHAKMVTLMERLWPEACGIAPVPAPTTSTSSSTPSSSSLSSSSSIPGQPPVPATQAPLSSQQQQQPQNEAQRRASYQEINFVPQSVKKAENEQHEGILIH